MVPIPGAVRDQNILGLIQEFRTSVGNYELGKTANHLV